MNNKTITRNKVFSQLFLLIFFLLSSFIVPNNYDMLLPIMLVGALSIYIFSPSTSFIYSFLYVIDPMAIFKLSAISIVPIFLCFLHFSLNGKIWLSILLRDPYLLKIMRVCFIFSLYQILVSILILSGQDLYYLFKNVRYWLGIWLIVPAYIFVYLDRKNIFVSIVIVVLTILVLYYLSFFGIYNFFDFQEFKRSSEDDGIMRFFSFDLRQITKIFVYLVPSFLIIRLRNLRVKFIVIVIGLGVYLSVLIAILRTEMFYLFIGSVLTLLVSLKKFQSIGKFKIIVLSIFFVLSISSLFPLLFDNILETWKMTINFQGSFNSDESLNIRKNEQLPILYRVIESSPFFGGGLYSVSAEATNHHLLYDIPVLGAFGAYGIIGMLIYYSRFIYIFARYRALRMTQRLLDEFPVECLLVNGLLAYFITMISFRTLHINMELAFDFGMAEFGLFIGGYFALIRILKEKKVI